MSEGALTVLSALLMGIGATLTFDLWGWLLKRAFQVAPSNICLVGRWLGYMPGGIFMHANIGTTPPKKAECSVGWIAHYLIGVTFASIFIALAGRGWLENPAPVPAIAFGIGTVLAPFAIMQPSMGLGIAASKAPKPALARLRSLLNHTAFGVGLYLFGWLAGRMM